MAYSSSRNRRSSADAGWEQAHFEASTQLAILAAAQTGAGKTNFLLSAGHPDRELYVFSLDPNNRSLFRKKQSKFPLFVREYALPGVANPKGDSDAQEKAKAEWDRFVTDFEALWASKGDQANVVIGIDEASMLRGLQMIATFGKSIQIPRHLYTAPNAHFARLLGLWRQHTAHFVALARLKEEYEDKVIKTVERGQVIEKEVSEKTGRLIPEGYNKASFCVNVEVHLLKDNAIEVPEGEPEEDAVADRFGMRVVKCTERPALEGEAWWGRTKQGTRRTEFPWLASRVYPDTKLADWR